MSEEAKQKLEKLLLDNGWQIAIDFYDENGQLKGLAICEPEYVDTMRNMIPTEMEMVGDQEDGILH